MINVFISVPMKNKTKEEIDNMINIMKAKAQEELTVEGNFVNTIVQNKPPYTTNKEAVWYLSKSIEILSSCQAIVCLKDKYIKNNPGCKVEKTIAKNYGIEVIEVDLEEVNE